jgi:hypothetical protein
VTTVVTPCATVINSAKAAIRYHNGAQNRIISISAFLSKKNINNSLLLHLSYLEQVVLLFSLGPALNSAAGGSSKQQ